ncbi:protein arginine kinase [Paenibacillus agricola]|uniref:Protein-arginine kinase n=1 Tax=Paenibacillus agricola TaxID=2716264 RepID=A0ABX0JGQ5_9BACL|nr:protein arginine kinase [Paenibacillus agricola]NHN35108.1 protein arginine kinase [Paenibacillus agricola]
MEINRFTEHALSDWMKGDSPDSDIVISSRVRIARNLQSYPFPMLSTSQQSNEVLDTMSGILDNEELSTISHFTIVNLEDLNELEKRVLVEKHLISPALANESRNGAVILSDNESISIMVNEEDHLRIQCLCSGFQIKEAWDMASQLDDVFEEYLEYAFDEKRGYLTSCPTNVGTGIRASVMIHLPALVLTQQINRILSAITQVGLAVRGLYGEGSEALGNLFQISNQITLGQSEQEIIDNLCGVVRQLIEHERVAREKLQIDTKAKLLDKVSRSFGIMSYAAIMDSKEAAQRLSDVRLGIDLGIIKNVSMQAMNELMVMTQPGFLQQHAGEKLNAEERDIRRAQLIREKLTSEHLEQA